MTTEIISLAKEPDPILAKVGKVAMASGLGLVVFGVVLDAFFESSNKQ